MQEKLILASAMESVQIHRLGSNDFSWCNQIPGLVGSPLERAETAQAKGRVVANGNGNGAAHANGQPASNGDAQAATNGNGTAHANGQPAGNGDGQPATNGNGTAHTNGQPATEGTPVESKADAPKTNGVGPDSMLLPDA